MKKIVTVFSCLLFLAFCFPSTAYAADIIPAFTTENDFFYGILLVVLLVICFLLGLLLGRNLGSSKKARLEKENHLLTETKANPIDPNTFGQESRDRGIDPDARPLPRNPRNRYYNYW